MRLQISRNIQRTRVAAEPDRPVDFPSNRPRPTLVVQEDAR